MGMGGELTAHATKDQSRFCQSRPIIAILKNRVGIHLDERVQKPLAHDTAVIAFSVQVETIRGWSDQGVDFEPLLRAGNLLTLPPGRESQKRCLNGIFVARRNGSKVFHLQKHSP